MTLTRQMARPAHDATHRRAEMSIAADDGGMSEELSLMIFAYVECEAGRDAPLSPEDEKRVRRGEGVPDERRTMR